MTSKKQINWPSCDFKIGAVNILDIPPTSHNEVAFAGRSNVGKSSLINAVTGRNTLSRTSKKPGCTRQLNFFLLDEKIYLVDMPGYGFAERGKKEISGWNRLINDYLVGRVNLRRIFLLIDSRHGLKPNDLRVMKHLDERAVVYQIVLTKSDKTSKPELEKIINSIETASKKHPAMHPNIIVTSSNEKLGIDILRNEITALI
jgi:GTP-binding protein